MKKVLTVIIILSFFGCAKKAQNLKATYVPPSYYSKHTCNELEDEMFNVNRQMHIVAASVDQHSKRDKIKTGVGAVLFWPTLFFIKGKTSESAEYSRLLGEKDAIEYNQVKKECSVRSAT